ncbi:MAG: hypothetical protein IJ228_05695 [Succinivibrio sp.]|nr:hypothetical protein [Succinivibrio sp.]
MSNDYKTIEDVADELDLTRPIKDNRYWGCKFEFKGHSYRFDSSGMMSGPGIDTDPQKGLYVVAEVFWFEDKKGAQDCYYELVGQYRTFEEAINQCKICGLKLGDVLISNDCEVTGKDGIMYRVLTQEEVLKGEW